MLPKYLCMPILEQCSLRCQEEGISQHLNQKSLEELLLTNVHSWTLVAPTVPSLRINSKLYKDPLCIFLKRRLKVKRRRSKDMKESLKNLRRCLNMNANSSEGPECNTRERCLQKPNSSTSCAKPWTKSNKKRNPTRRNQVTPLTSSWWVWVVLYLRVQKP